MWNLIWSVWFCPFLFSGFCFVWFCLSCLVYCIVYLLFSVQFSFLLSPYIFVLPLCSQVWLDGCPDLWQIPCSWCYCVTMTFIKVTGSLPFILAGVKTSCELRVLIIFMRDRTGVCVCVCVCVCKARTHCCNHRSHYYMDTVVWIVDNCYVCLFVHVCVCVPTCAT